MSQPDFPLPSPTETPGNSGSKHPGGVVWIFWGPNGLRAGWRVLVFLVLFFLLAAILGWPAHRLLARSPRGELVPGVAIVREGITLAAALIAAWIMSCFERRPFSSYGLPGRAAFGRRFWEGALWGVVTISLLLLGIWAGHGFSYGVVMLHGSRLAFYALAWLFAFLLVGFFEEFFMRGYVQFTLTTGLGFWPAALLTSAGFGALHLSNAGEAWPGALSAGLIGLFFCLTLRRTGDLWFAVGMHAFFDYGESFLYSVPDSGATVNGHLLSSSFHGPQWLTGGTIGPEGSAWVFVLIGLLFLVFHWTHRKAKYPPVASLPSGIVP